MPECRLRRVFVIDTVAFSSVPHLTFCAKITQYAQNGLILYKMETDKERAAR
jgi:hypothetical protein